MKTLVRFVGFAAVLATGFWIGRISLRDSSAPDSQLPSPNNLHTTTAFQKSAVAQVAARLETECRQGVWHRTKEWEVIFNSLSAPEVGALMPFVRHLLIAPAQEELRTA